MDEQDRINRILEHPFSKKIEEDAEAERTLKRRKVFQAIKEENEPYEVARIKLDTAIKATQVKVEKLEGESRKERQELNGLYSQQRIAAIDHERVIKILEDKMRETADPAIQPAINECYQKIGDSRLSKAAIIGSNQTKPDIFGFVKRTMWSNVNGLESYREIVRGAQVELEAMKFEIHEDVLGHVKAVMSRIPKLDFDAPVQEERYNPEAERIKSQRAFMDRG